MGKAGEEEAEEGFGVGVKADLGVGGIGRAGGARVGARKTFVINANMHRLDRAKGGIDEEGDGHRVEERRRLLAPLVVEERERVCERSALAEEECALNFVELELGSVEGHDEEWHASGEQFLGGRNVIEDVPLRLRRCGRAEAEIAVPALDGAAHQNDALELAERGGVFVDGGADVHQRADSDQRDLARVAADLVEEEGDGVGMGRLGEAVVLGVTTLGERAFWRSGRAGGYGNVLAASFGEKAVKNLGAGFRVAKSGGDAEDLEFGAAESKSDGEGVVNVVADVRVDDDFFRRILVWSGRTRDGLGFAGRSGEQDRKTKRTGEDRIESEHG